MARRSKAEASESNPEKKAKFTELAQSRVSKAIKSVKVIGNLSNRSSYEWSDEQIEKMGTALHGAVDSMLESFSSNGKTKGGFSFDD